MESPLEPNLDQSQASDASNDNRKKIIRRKVSPGSHEYLTHLRNIRFYEGKDLENCFGGDTIQTIKLKRRFIESLSGVKLYPEAILEDIRRRHSVESLTKDIEEEIEKSKKQFLEYLSKPALEFPCIEILVDALTDQEIQGAVEKAAKSISSQTLEELKVSDTLHFFLKVLPVYREALVFSVALKENLINHEIWLKVVERHVEQFIDFKKKFEEEIEPGFRRDFLKSLEELYDAGIVPSIEKAKETISLVRVEVQDAANQLFEEKYGHYSCGLHVVVIGSHGINKKRFKKDIYKTYVHEMFHAISGKTIQEIKDPSIFVNDEDDEDDEMFEYKVDRVGFKILNRFRWLNEAVTELLAQTIVPDTERKSYKYEIELFRLIMEKCGLSSKDFFRAYFENYDPNEVRQSGSAIIEWKRIYGIITDKLGRGFLVSVDNKVKTIGIKETLELLKSGGI